MTYSELIASISDWMARNDIQGSEAQFIEFAENKMNRVMRIREQENSYLEQVLDDGTVPVPEDFIEWKTIFIVPGAPKVFAAHAIVMDMKARGDLNFERIDCDGLSALEVSGPESVWRDNCKSGRPKRISRTGNQFYLAPCPDGPYTVAGYYYRKWPRLSEDVPTNWLSINAGDCYLAGALMECAAYVKDAQQYEYWRRRFSEAVDELQGEADRERFAGSQIRQRVV